MPNVTNFSLENVKENLTFEAVVDVLERCGYEVVRNKFKLREDENTASATISYKSLNIKDYGGDFRSEEHTSELQSHSDLVCRLLLEKKKKKKKNEKK